MSISVHVCLSLCLHLRKPQATRPAWTWLQSWCVWSRRTAGSVWSVRPAPCVSSRTMRTRWCSVTNVTEDFTHSVWAWIQYPPVSEWTDMWLKLLYILIWHHFGRRVRECRFNTDCHFSLSVCVLELFLSLSFLSVLTLCICISSGLWVCEVCDKDSNTPKKKGGAKTPRKPKSAQKWPTASSTKWHWWLSIQYKSLTKVCLWSNRIIC